MNDPKSSSSANAASWDIYWQGTGETGAYSMGGVNHPAIQAFWDEFFQEARREYQAPKIIDFASGSGAVLERAMAVFGTIEHDFTCLDVSEAAITNIRKRFPHVRGVVADACLVPLESEEYDIVTSQFGVEYAGPDALNEAARLLASGGRLCLLLHNEAGSIYQECKTSLDAISRLQESEFIPGTMEMFRTGFPASRGADRAPYDAAARQLAPAVQALESIMQDYGQHVAGDTIVRLYSDVDRIHRNMQHHEPAEVLDWLQRMDGELEAYADRMSSMCASAIDGETFERICKGFSKQGYSLLRAELLSAPDQDLPLAWVLVAEKSGPRRGPVVDADAPSVREEPEPSPASGQERLQAWTNQQVETAVKTLTKRQVFGGLLVEAKPAWVLPFQILIGKVRERGQEKTFDWFICGEVPTDLAKAEAATTPREAAKYFALKWQRDAALGTDFPDEHAAGPAAATGGQTGQLSLAEHAEALYELVDDPRVWPQGSDD